MALDASSEKTALTFWTLDAVLLGVAATLVYSKRDPRERMELSLLLFPVPLVGAIMYGLGVSGLAIRRYGPVDGTRERLQPGVSCIILLQLMQFHTLATVSRAWGVKAPMQPLHTRTRVILTCVLVALWWPIAVSAAVETAFVKFVIAPIIALLLVLQVIEVAFMGCFRGYACCQQCCCCACKRTQASTLPKLTADPIVSPRAGAYSHPDTSTPVHAWRRACKCSMCVWRWQHGLVTCASGALTVFFVMSSLGGMGLISGDVVQVARLIASASMSLGEIIILVKMSETIHAESAVQAKDRAHHRQRAREHALVRFMFHELRVPLNTATLASEVLWEGEHARTSRGSGDDEHVRESLVALRASLIGASTVLNELSEYDAIEAGELKAEISRIAVRSVVDPVVSSARMVARGHNSGVSFSLSDEVPRTIETDPRCLQQLIFTLLTHAIRNSREGCSVRLNIDFSEDISLSNVSSASGHESAHGALEQSRPAVPTVISEVPHGTRSLVPGLIIEVFDSAPLIADDGALRELFEPFAMLRPHGIIAESPAMPPRGHHASEVDMSGSLFETDDYAQSLGNYDGSLLPGEHLRGIGMALGVSVVSLLGGRIGVRRNEDIGNVFTVHIPVGVVEERAVVVDPVLSHATGRHAYDSARNWPGARRESTSPRDNVRNGSNLASSRHQSQGAFAFKATHTLSGALDASPSIRAARTLANLQADEQGAAAAGASSAIGTEDHLSPTSRRARWGMGAGTPAAGTTTSTSNPGATSASTGRLATGSGSTPTGGSSVAPGSVPAATGASPVGAGDTHAGSWDRTTRGPGEAVPKPTVVVVDDAHGNRAMLCRLLQRRGLRCVEACDGAAALRLLDELHSAWVASGAEWVSQACVACVLLDKEMPILDGYGFMAELRKKAEWDNTPVLGVTGNASIADQREFINRGVRAVIPKPVRIQRLVDELKACGISV